MHLHLAREEAAAGLKAVYLDTEQILFERRRGPPADASPEEAQGVAIHLQELLGKAEVALCRQELAGLHPHLGPEPARPLRHLGAFHLQLARRHPDAPGFAAVQIERDDYARREVIVRASHIFLYAEIEHGIRAQSGLLEAP